jgi:intracellular sulfur oxidation DsrE/DsrF family protein
VSLAGWSNKSPFLSNAWQARFATIFAVRLKTGLPLTINAAPKLISVQSNPTRKDMRTFFTGLPPVLGSLALATVLLSSTSTNAADDHASLTGLKEVKVAFDIKEGEGKLLLSRLDIIDETRQSLIQQGVTPHFILAFRGPATKLVQTDQDKIKPDDRAMAAKIALRIKEMNSAPGVDGFEQCAVAAREQGTKTELVLPEIRVVGNAFVSLMAYQAKGYAYIAP